MITTDALWLLANIGREITAKRKKLKLTQLQLADLIGVKYQQVQRWERSNYQSCSTRKLIEVLKAIHCQEMKQSLLNKSRIQLINSTSSKSD